MPKPTITRKELENRFHDHKASEQGTATHHVLSDAFTEIGILVAAQVPAGRELALVLTKLEEAKMWASAGVARNPDTR